MQADTLILVMGLLVNLVAILGFSNKLERRLTRVETILSVFMRAQHISPRVSDGIDDDQSN